jgi:predicted transcriptional regulator
VSTLTIRLDEELDVELTRLAKAAHRTKSDLVREMLRRQAALAAFEQARSLIVPAAENAGHLTDEDVFRDLS